MRSLLVASLVLLPALALADEPTSAEIEAWGKEVEKGLAEGKPQVLDRSFDGEGFAERVISKMELAKDLAAGYRAGLSAGLGLGQQFAQAIEGDGSYVFLRAVSDPPRARFRMLQASGGLNYHDFYMTKKDGKIRAEDVYVYLNAESLSVTVRRMLRTNLASQQGNTAFLKDVEKIQKAQQHLQLEDYKAAQAAIAGLSAKFARLPHVMILKIQIAFGLGDEQLVTATKAFELAYPDSPALHMLMIDKLIVQKKFEELYGRLDTLDDQVGGDPYLDVMRANCLVLEKKFDKAKVAAKRAMKREPTLRNAHYSMIDVGLGEKDWKLVVDELVLLEKEYGVSWSDLTTVEGFKEFCQTEEYRAWKNR